MVEWNAYRYKSQQNCLLSKQCRQFNFYFILPSIVHPKICFIVFKNVATTIASIGFKLMIYRLQSKTMFFIKTLYVIYSLISPSKKYSIVLTKRTLLMTLMVAARSVSLSLHFKELLRHVLQ